MFISVSSFINIECALYHAHTMFPKLFVMKWMDFSEENIIFRVTFNEWTSLCCPIAWRDCNMQHEERVLEIYHFLPRKNQFYQINYNCRIVKMVVNLVANSLNHNDLCYFSEATFYTCVCVCVCVSITLLICECAKCLPFSTWEPDVSILM